MNLAYANHPRHTGVGLAGLALAILAFSCSQSTTPAPYQLSATGSDSFGAVVVSGKTSMPDGGVVTVYAWSEVDQHHPEWTGWATAKDGAFSATVRSESWQGDTVHISIAIMGDARQSSAVLAVIGSHGDRLSDTDAYVDEDGERFIEAHFTVTNRAPSFT